MIKIKIQNYWGLAKGLNASVFDTDIHQFKSDNPSNIHLYSLVRIQLAQLTVSYTWI